MVDEEIKKPGEEEPAPNPALQEAELLNKLKAENDALKKQNAGLEEAKREYYDKVINGQVPEENAPKEKSLAECRKDLFEIEDKSSMTNLDYAKKVVALDEACKRETGESCFLPKGKDVRPTYEEVQTAEKMNSVLKECIEEAKDDPAIFNQALARRTR